MIVGDYVDRGKNGVEVMCLLMAYKIRYPDRLYILRGNHECANITKLYGFYDECLRRYDVKMWRSFTNLFNYLPAAAVIDERILCMQGGLSPSL